MTIEEAQDIATNLHAELMELASKVEDAFLTNKPSLEW
jgi:hypothetical protein